MEPNFGSPGGGPPSDDPRRRLKGVIVALSALVTCGAEILACFSELAMLSRAPKELWTFVVLATPLLGIGVGALMLKSGHRNAAVGIWIGSGLGALFCTACAGLLRSLGNMH